MSSSANNQHKLLGYMQSAQQAAGSFAEQQRPTTSSSYLSRSGPYDRDYSTEVRKAGINLDFPGRSMRHGVILLHRHVTPRHDGVHGSLRETARPALLAIYTQSSTGLHIARSTIGASRARFLSERIHAQVCRMTTSISTSTIDHSFLFSAMSSPIQRRSKNTHGFVRDRCNCDSSQSLGFSLTHKSPHATRAANRRISQSLFFK